MPSNPNYLAAVVHEAFGAKGLEVQTEHSDSTYENIVRLRYPSLGWNVRISDESMRGTDDRAIVWNIESGLREMQAKVRADFGLDQEMQEAVARATQAGHDAALREAITKIESRRSHRDGRLPTGWSDVLDIIKHLS